MRTLTATLQSAQQSASVKALAKIVLTHGAATYTYGVERILDIKHPEEQYSHTAEILLDNADRTLDAISLKGYQAVISYGAGDEYSPCAPLWVNSQTFSSAPGKLSCTLMLEGIPNDLASDEASENYTPDDTDTKSVKTLLSAILGATLGCFSHCHAYTVVYDSEDSLLTSYKPKDGFRIYTGDSRLAKCRTLLDFTKCVMRFEDDGCVHVLRPTISGTTYDYEYSLASGHTIFSKAYRDRLVIPNYITVSSPKDADGISLYSGHASDSESYGLKPKRAYKTATLESNAEGTEIAEALLAQAMLNSEQGAATVPMNCGAEVFDYVKVTDSRQQDVRTGNIGYITRHYSPGKFEMTFGFGNAYSMLKARKALAELKNLTDTGNYFARLEVKDLFAENIQANNLDMIWLDPEGNIDLSQIGDTLDSLPDGVVYARVKSVHLDAGGLKIDENVFYSPGYDPTDKFDLAANDLDDIPNGTAFHRTKASSLTSTGLVILDQVYTTGGTYGLVRKTQINAGYIELTSSGFLINEDNITAQDGAVVIDGANGITLDNTDMYFLDSGDPSGFLGYSSGVGMILSALNSGEDLSLYALGGDILIYAGGHDVLPDDQDTDLGDATYYFDDINYSDLYDRTASPLKVESALEKIKSIGTHKVIKQKKGEQPKEVETFDRDTLPSELISPVTQADHDKALLHYQKSQERIAERARRLTLYKERIGQLESLGGQLKPHGQQALAKLRQIVAVSEANPLPVPVKREPQPGISMNATQGLFLSAIKELTERIEKLEAKK